MVGTGIYPPWVTIQQSVVPTPGGPAQAETQYPTGYSFIFDPPQVRDVQGPYLRISIRIDFVRLLIQWFVVALFFGAAMFVFKDSDKKSLSEWLKSMEKKQ